jgi:hypothetical protein
MDCFVASLLAMTVKTWSHATSTSFRRQFAAAKPHSNLPRSCRV